MSEIFYIDNDTELSTGEKVRKILAELGGLRQIVRPGSLVLLKPNFVAPFPHATTSFEVLKVVIDEVKKCQAHPIIAESSGFEFDTETTFRILGAYEFARRNDVEIINIDKRKFTKCRLHSGYLGEIELSELVQQADVIINLPKLKRHSLTKITIGIKNLFGFLSRASRRKIHAIDLESGIFELSQIIKPDLVIVDGSMICSRAVYGEYQDLGIVIGGTDMYAIDLFGCKFLQADYRKIGHLKIALDRGMAKENVNIIKLINSGTEKTTLSYFPDQPDSLMKKLHRLIYQLVYLVDIPYAKVFRGQSIIPLMHFYFGIRPFLDRKKCTDCGDCVPICPVDAIKIPERRIVANLCMPVRCMKCIPVCPESAIRLKGRDTHGLSGDEKRIEQ